MRGKLNSDYMECFGEFLNYVPFSLWCQRSHVTNHIKWAHVTSWSASGGLCGQPVWVYHVMKKMCIPSEWVGGGGREQEKPDYGEADMTIGKGTWIRLSTNCSSWVFPNRDTAVCFSESVWNSRARQPRVKLKLDISYLSYHSSFFAPSMCSVAKGGPY